jgi:hypothetical protein
MSTLKSNYWTVKPRSRKVSVGGTIIDLDLEAQVLAARKAQTLMAYPDTPASPLKRGAWWRRGLRILLENMTP